MWEFQHSVETRARRDFAWAFWTNVDNWAFDSSIEWVRLDGPFASGTKGETKSPGLDAVGWTLSEVHDEKEAVIEVSLPEATFSFHWRFEDLADGGTRITQRAMLTGSNTESFVEQAAPMFEKGIPEGMQKLVSEIELALERRQNE